MRKIFMTVISAYLLFILFACTHSNEPSRHRAAADRKKVNKTMVLKDIRESVWTQLSIQDKKRIRSWKDAKVSKMVLREEMIPQLLNTSYLGKEVYLIDIPTINKSLPNNMIVYADTHTYTLIGYGFVD